MRKSNSKMDNTVSEFLFQYRRTPVLAYKSRSKSSMKDIHNLMDTYYKNFKKETNKNSKLIDKYSFIQMKTLCYYKS